MKPYSGRRPGAWVPAGNPKGGRGTRRPVPVRQPAVEPVAAPEPPPAPRPVAKAQKPVPAPEPQEPPEPVEPVEIDRGDVDWPKLVKAMRDEWEYSQEEAAEDLDVSVTTWKRWESGAGNPGTAMQDKLLEAMADYTSIDLRDFLLS
jgi:DNA-binding XRE family transcriptional regulator